MASFGCRPALEAPVRSHSGLLLHRRAARRPDKGPFSLPVFGVAAPFWIDRSRMLTRRRRGAGTRRWKAGGRPRGVPAGTRQAPHQVHGALDLTRLVQVTGTGKVDGQ